MYWSYMLLGSSLHGPCRIMYEQHRHPGYAFFPETDSRWGMCQTHFGSTSALYDRDLFTSDLFTSDLRSCSSTEHHSSSAGTTNTTTNNNNTSFWNFSDLCSKSRLRRGGPHWQQQLLSGGRWVAAGLL